MIDDTLYNNPTILPHKVLCTCNVHVMYINNIFHTLSIIHVHVEMTNDTCTCT